MRSSPATSVVRASAAPPPALGDADATNEFIVVTLLVASTATASLKGAGTGEDLRQTLRILGSTASSELMALEVIWQPEGRGDVLSAEELLTATESSAPLRISRFSSTDQAKDKHFFSGSRPSFSITSVRTIHWLLIHAHGMATGWGAVTIGLECAVERPAAGETNTTSLELQRLGEVDLRPGRLILNAPAGSATPPSRRHSRYR